MATHDYVIANGTGAAVRSDLNNALAAIVSNNSGSSEPGTTYAYQWWADTNANVLKIRNSANDGWITLRELDGTMLIEDGSASSPGLAFADDTNTGIFSGGADEIGFATGGAERLEIRDAEVVFNDPSNDVDFRVESNGQTHMLFVDAGNDRVGIGTSSPGLTLHIQDGALASAPTPNSNCDVVIEGSTDTGIQFLSDTQTQLRFGDAGSTGAGSLIYNHSNDYLMFSVNGSEAMRIDSSRRLLVGRSSTGANNAILQAVSATGPQIVVENSGTSAAFMLFVNSDSGVGTGNGLFVGLDANDGYIWNYENNDILFGTSDTERARVRSNGDVIIGPYRGPNTFGTVAKNVPYEIKVAPYGWANGSEIASISMGSHGGTGQDDGQIVFKTATNVHSSSTGLVERARINDTGQFFVGKTSPSFTTEGACISQGDGNTNFATALGKACTFSRNSNDGTVVSIRQDGTEEGTISVSGTSVSYNGGHLARWSQLASGAERTEILRGSVLSNLDEMCEWAYAAQEAVPAQEAVLYTEQDELPEGASVGDIKTPAVEGSPAVEAYTEDNEQLNRMKVSDVEGDVNVAGVFQAWDDDDDTHTNDFYCAMTGDFVIRIAQGTTVARGDLLMSAGDGTAKPQDDDIVRSKTIAKVTSTTVSTTYSDGSYCVPCVLMAC